MTNDYFVRPIDKRDEILLDPFDQTFSNCGLRTTGGPWVHPSDPPGTACQQPFICRDVSSKCDATIGLQRIVFKNSDD